MKTGDPTTIQTARIAKLTATLTDAGKMLEEISNDIHRRVYEAEELGKADAWKDADAFMYDGSMASMREEIATTLAAETCASEAPLALEDLTYQQLYNAISDATHIPAGAIYISVEKFRAAIRALGKDES